MKTISVREVAEALGISTRGVLYRREKGRLKGILVKNERGVDEYRIYPTKEIIEGLKKINSPLVESPDAIEGFDVVDAQAVTEEDRIYDSAFGPDDIVEPPHHSSSPRQEWSETARTAANGMADELWNNVISRFVEKLEQKDQLIGEMRIELLDKDRQLKLLPDFQKRAEDERARAEEERKAAELRALEVEALNKQVAAMQSERAAAERVQQKVQQLEESLAENQRQAQDEIERLKAEKEAQAKAVEELKVADEAKLAEKEAEAAAIKEHLQLLSATVEELKKPKPTWWKKWFTSAT